MEASMPTAPMAELGDGESDTSGALLHSYVETSSANAMSNAVKTSIAGSTTQSVYRPQFSAATSFILSRIKRGSECSASSKSDAPASALCLDDQAEDGARARLRRSMSRTLPMPLPAGQRPSAAAPSVGAAGSCGLGHKRKREDEHKGVGFAQNTISFPTPVLKAVTSPSATPHESTPEDSGIKNCSNCKSHIWTQQNTLVSCSRCPKSWHQQCASPEITEETAKDPVLVCAECAIAKWKHDDGGNAVEPQNQTEMLREKNLSALSEGVVPARAELVGFCAGQASDSARTEYFYGKKKTELLNILSFCDQLKPQLLIDILVSVSKKHPDLPMFDSPDWSSQLLSAAPAKPKHSCQPPRPASKPRHGHSVLDPKSKHKHRVAKKILKITSVVEAGEAAPEENRDSLPPTWPKAGNGLYAKLSVEDEDRAFLLDENDEEAFSHFEVDKFGKQIAVTVCA